MKKELLSSLALRITGMIASYAAIIVTTRFFGIQKFGEFTIFLTCVILLSTTAFAGTNTSLVTKLSFGKKVELESDRKLYTQALAFTCTLSVFIVIVFIIVPNTLAEKISSSLFHPIAGLLLPLLAYQIIKLNAAMFRAKERTIMFYLADSIIFSLLTITLTISLHTKLQPITVFTVSALTTSTILTYLNRKYLSVKYVNFLNCEFYGYLKFSAPMFMTSALAISMTWTDLLMLSFFKSPSEVGAYNVSIRVVSVSIILLLAANTIIGPRIASYHKKNKQKEARIFFQKANTYVLILSLPVTCALYLNVGLIHETFGEGFLLSTTATKILLIGFCARYFTGSIGEYFIHSGHQMTQLKLSTTFFIINIILNYLFIPIYSINGAAIATSATLVFGRCVSLWIFWEKFRFFPITYKLNRK